MPQVALESLDHFGQYGFGPILYARAPGENELVRRGMTIAINIYLFQLK